MELAGKHAIVTGAGSGIGEALARRFAAEGARAVVVADLDGDKAAAVAADIGGLAVRTDVAVDADVQALVARAEEANGPIDLMFSNAGIFTGGGMDVANDAWERIWQINVMAHIYAARAVLPAMLARGEGYIASTASAAGLLANIGAAPYSVTKAAAVAVAEWISITHGDAGIKVSCLCPQGVRTPMLMGTGGDGNFLMPGSLSAEEVADVVVAGLRDEAFLILPHPEVAEYVQRKATDRDRWLAGMRRMAARALGR